MMRVHLERDVLGCVLLQPRLFPALRLRMALFQAPHHRAILAAMRASWRRTGTITEASILAEARRSGAASGVTTQTLANLVDAIPWTPHVGRYVEALRST